ncbi:MFS transporter [Undibacterium sp. TJN25]|uniref:MFS transporter n=1 Tax=Undibacterium sp. TJN25 TaxID=3413056 RepID=UPI003BF354CA
MSSSSQRKGQRARVAVASTIGTVIEFYDFTIFGTAAALVFSKVFFPSLGAAAGTAVALATFGVAFVIRPFGAIFFGHFGDRIGRKNTLVITLLLMGLATVGIGLLPTAQTIGAWAPVLLVALRVTQGLAMGGEWAGASVMSTESAPADMRGKYGMYPQLGPALGFILSSTTFLLSSLTMSDQAFLDWGWRIPFLASAILIVVGLGVRIALEETETFQKATSGSSGVRKFPVVSLFRDQSRELVLASASTVAVFGLFYLAITYVTSYGTQTLGLSKVHMLLIGMAGGVSLAVFTIVGGLWSDKVGRKRVLLIGNAACLVFALLLFPLIDTREPAALVLGLVLLQGAIGLAYGPLGAYLPELFAAQYRYTGAGLAYNIATVVGGALTPIIASQLIIEFGSPAVGYYSAGLCVISLIALSLSKETRLAQNIRGPAPVASAPTSLNNF